MLKKVQEMSKNFKNEDEVKKELRNIQSKKSRLKKQKMRKDYDTQMTRLLKEEQLLKEVKEYFSPSRKPVTQFTKKDVEDLNHDETIKALKSIQSKKSNTRYLKDDTEYKEALKVEKLLLEHKKNVKPIEDTVIKKTDVDNLIGHLETLEETLDKDKVIEYLKNLKK